MLSFMPLKLSASGLQPKTIAMPLTLFFFVFVLAVRGQEWTRFRGPNGTGIGHAKGLPAALSEANVDWKIELPGSGHSSPVLWGEELFITTTGDKNGGISVLCLNPRNGTQIWKRDFPLTPFSRHQYNSFASSTPAVDAQRLYVVWNQPEHYFLTALDHKGNKLWQRDFGTFISQHGCGTSPIVFEGKVFLGDFQDDEHFVPGGTQTGRSSILAVDAATGKTLWETPRRSTVVAYSTPCIYEARNHKPALIFNSQSHGISALDPETGKVLWEYDKAFDKRSVSSPLIAGDVILGSCGTGGGGSFVTAIHPPEGGAESKPELAYQIKKSAPYVPTGVVVNDLAWLWSDGGIVTCLKVATGEIQYQERVGGNFFGSPVCVDGRLYCVSTSGELVCVEAKEQFKVLDRFQLHELSRSTPAVALDRLFVRTEKHLWCFGAEKEHPAP